MKLETSVSLWIILQYYKNQIFLCSSYDSEAEAMSSTKTHTQFKTFQAKGYLSAANAIEFSNRLLVTVKSTTSPAFLVDMKDVEFMDSAGLMVLIKAFRLAQSSGKRFGICSVAPSVRMMFELTQLDNVFEIFEAPANFEDAIG